MSIGSDSPMSFKGAICVRDRKNHGVYNAIIKTRDIRYVERSDEGTKIEYTNPKTHNAASVIIPEKLETVLLAYNAVKDTELSVNFYV